MPTPAAKALRARRRAIEYMFPWVIAVDAAINTIIVAELWFMRGDEAACARVMALWACRVVFNLVGNFLMQLSTKTRLERATASAVALVNMGFTIGFIQAAHWSTPALVQNAFQIVAMDVFFKKDARPHTLMWTLIALSVAGIDGQNLFLILPSLLLGIAVHRIAHLRSLELSEALESATANHREAVKMNSELAELHRQLVQKEKLSSIGMLAAGIAHEINNPMSFVTSNVAGLMKDLPRLNADPDLLAEYQADILPATLDGIRRVNTIVSDLRRFARVDTDGHKPFDLNEEVQAAVRIAHSRIANRCDVELDLGKIPELFGRSQQIAQVVINLVVNAAQAMKSRGRIEISTHVERGCAILSVSDNGCGMTDDTLSQLFQPFFTTKPVGEGTGLGLSVVHGIISAHGGTVGVRSRLGVGTCFTISLPLPASPVIALSA